MALNLQIGALNRNETDPVMISIDTNDLEVTKLIGCYPNPFNPETTISFQISDPAQVKLQVYNVRGQLVNTLINEFQQPGHYDVIWNSEDSDNRPVSSGVYFYKMQADNIQQTQKMLLLK